MRFTATLLRVIDHIQKSKYALCVHGWYHFPLWTRPSAIQMSCIIFYPQGRNFIFLPRARHAFHLGTYIYYPTSEAFHFRCLLYKTSAAILLSRIWRRWMSLLTFQLVSRSFLFILNNWVWINCVRVRVRDAIDFSYTLIY